MKLNIPEMRKSGNKSTTGEHGPDPVVKSDLPLVRNHDHTHSIHKLDYVSVANEFGVKE